MAALELDLFLCRSDNFGVLIHDPASGMTASIDAPEEQPILEALRERFELAGRPVEIIETPGHTAGHICFHFPEDKLLFAADTLFALGCGRLFEGTPETMWQSLTRLMALPDDTTVYFGHEYTLSNARFAVTVDPDNAELRARAAEVEETRCDGGFTAPTTIGLEKRTNPFLRAADPAIRAHLGLRDASDAAVFAEIRKRKDNF
jgi:hydroxyacylglutathione hydrolase